MRKPLTFFELQSSQREHDLRNHVDIYTLPLFDKMNHYVLHFVKYAARLVQKKSPKEMTHALQRTYIDAFLISLAAANALNIDLDKEIRARFNRVAEDVNSFIVVDKRISVDLLYEHSKNAFISSAGAMADTMEKRDHMDDMYSRDILEKGVVDIVQMILWGSHHLQFDIVEETLNRRKLIAELKIT